ncbi:MAG: hypothetical protein HYV15_07500 [Elusimicrobia bacterium]|nr:hypothetical protein [Elusimicrobiota bacterium]
MDHRPGLSRLRRLCLFLLAADLAYCTLTTLWGRAPAWGMFSRMEDLSFTLEDASGAPVDLRAWVAPVFYFADRAVLVETAECACAKSSAPRPWRPAVPAIGMERRLCQR